MRLSSISGANGMQVAAVPADPSTRAPPAPVADELAFPPPRSLGCRLRASTRIGGEMSAAAMHMTALSRCGSVWEGAWTITTAAASGVLGSGTPAAPAASVIAASAAAGDAARTLTSVTAAVASTRGTSSDAIRCMCRPLRLYEVVLNESEVKEADPDTSGRSVPPSSPHEVAASQATSTVTAERRTAARSGSGPPSSRHTSTAMRGSVQFLCHAHEGGSPSCSGGRSILTRSWQVEDERERPECDHGTAASASDPVPDSSE
mmetsp:Transcript_11837/g.37771  ORF Transcript_11837/g.37771 Transcript_11837/m.37771 type:complete len:262 (-) Transcript_11837:225-1010(-)